MLGMILQNAYLIWQGEPANPMAVPEVDLDNKSTTTTTSLFDEVVYCRTASPAAAAAADEDDARWDKVAFIKTYLMNNLKTYYFGFLVVNTW
jgi:hypothetical protein